MTTTEETTMDLTTQTPVEVDTALSEIHVQIYLAQHKRDIRWESVEYNAARYLGKTYRASISQTEIRDALAEVHEVEVTYKTSDLVEAFARYEDALAEVENLILSTQPYDEEYHRRGRWTRAFLVSSSNGHVHRDQRCSTCFPTTQYCWLPTLSGHDESEIVEKAGERACTVCYPSAPAEVLNRPTSLFTPDEIQKAKDREARAAAKVERDAKKLAKALLPDGSELVVNIDLDRVDFRGVGWPNRERFTTLASAKSWLTDSNFWGTDHSSYPAHALQTVAEAVAAKEGKNVETVLAEAAKRASKRR